MAISSGADYLESLRDGREVWLGGARVADVPTHPAFRGCVNTVAELYDMQRDPAYADLLTFDAGDGRAIPNRTARRAVRRTWWRCGG